MNFRHIPSLLFESALKWYNDQVSMYAAALAYYAIFSLAPMVIFVVSIAGIIFRRDDARQWLLANADPFVGPEVMAAIRSILDNMQDTPTTLVATIIGLVTLFLGTTRIIGHLRTSFNSIWEVPPRNDGGIWGLVKGHFSIFLMVIVSGVLLLVLAAASAVLTAASSYLDQFIPSVGSIIKLSDVVVTLTLGTALFAIMFKFLPDTKIAWGDVWIGAGFASLLFLAGKKLFGLYFASSAVRSAYGAAGSFVIVVLWIYYSAQIVFYGAEFTQVYAHRFGSRVRRDSIPHRERLHRK